MCSPQCRASTHVPRLAVTLVIALVAAAQAQGRRAVIGLEPAEGMLDALLVMDTVGYRKGFVADVALSGGIAVVCFDFDKPLPDVMRDHDDLHIRVQSIYCAINSHEIVIDQ